MADIDLKTETPDTTLPTTGFLFGADSQAAASPSVYPVANAITTILGNAASADLLSFNSDLILGRRAAANLRLGAADAAAPVAQTLSVQSVVTGTSNTAGQEFRIDGSQGTGTGAGGSLVFRVAPAGSSGSAVNALAAALTIAGNRDITATGNAIFGNSSATSIEFLGSFGNSLAAFTNAALTGVVSGLVLRSTSVLAFATGTNPASTVDLVLARDAANTLALRNGTAAQTFNVYNTFTDASNYSRVTIRADNGGGQSQIWCNAAGTGSQTSLGILASTITFSNAAGGARWAIDASGHFMAQTDNTFDIGASGATRPRDLFLGRNLVQVGAYHEMAEMTAPAAPAANGVRIYAVDNGSGKTQLMALFATGAAQQIAIEP
jgi:hypothetical protein